MKRKNLFSIFGLSIAFMLFSFHTNAMVWGKYQVGEDQYSITYGYALQVDTVVSPEAIIGFFLRVQKIDGSKLVNLADIEKDFKLEITHEEHKKIYDFNNVVNDRSSIAALLAFSEGGEYSFKILGKINDKPFELSTTCVSDRAYKPVGREAAQLSSEVRRISEEGFIVCPDSKALDMLGFPSPVFLKSDLYGENKNLKQELSAIQESLRYQAVELKYAEIVGAALIFLVSCFVFLHGRNSKKGTPEVGATNSGSMNP